MLMHAHKPLAELENPGEFIARHIGPDADDEAHMLSVIGAASRDALIDQIVPRSILRSQAMQLPAALSEAQALAELRTIAAKNRVLKSFIGQGYHGTHTPAVILRNVLENPAWYTAYTPYQAEISQGRLEALLNFQTMVADLTGMDIANGSMLDEATSAAEAMTLGDAHGQQQEQQLLRRRRRAAADAGRAAHARAAAGHHVDRRPGRGLRGRRSFRRVAAIPRRQRPRACAAAAGRCAACKGRVAGGGRRPAGAGAAEAARRTGRRHRRRQQPALRHADGQRRPARRLHGHAAMPSSARCRAGWWASASMRTARPAYRLALQTREQHIRREKATSNICTAQVLPAVVASMYAVYHGPQGLKRIARRVAAYTAVLAAGLKELGVALAHDEAFDTLEVRRSAEHCDMLHGRGGEGGHEPAPCQRHNARHHARRDHHARRPARTVGAVRRWPRQAARGR